MVTVLFPVDEFLTRISVAELFRVVNDVKFKVFAETAPFFIFLFFVFFFLTDSNPIMSNPKSKILNPKA